MTRPSAVLFLFAENNHAGMRQFFQPFPPNSPVSGALPLLPPSPIKELFVNEDTLFLPYPDQSSRYWMSNTTQAAYIGYEWWENTMTFPMSYREFKVDDSSKLRYTYLRVETALFSFLTQYTTKMVTERLGGPVENEQEEVVLDKLAQRDGQDKVNRILREFREKHKQPTEPVTLRAFVSQANSILGRDISREMAKANCPDRPVQTEEDVKACLAEDVQR